jgi:HlyD family secretion protein
MKRKVWIAAGLGSAALVATFVWALRPPPIPVETVEVRQGQFEQSVDEDGKTRVRERYLVSAPVAGRLERVRVKAGDAVRSGAIVAVLSPAAPAMVDARSARELSERIGAAQAGLSQTSAKVARAQAAFEQAQIDAARQDQLRGDGFIAVAALDQAQLALRLQARELDAARFAQQGAMHELAQARAALLRAREAAGARQPGSAWPVEAPVDGHVLRVLQESEASVGVGTALLEIGDPADLEILIDVLSSDGRRIASGARVDIDAGPGPRLSGRVRRVEPSAFTKVSALGVEEQRVNVIVDIVSPREQWRGLGDQFRVDARIIVAERADAVLAPVAALFRDGEHWAVYVAREGLAYKRRVGIGGRNNSEAWISDGLAPGERVIVYPSDSLADGKRLRTVRGPL